MKDLSVTNFNRGMRSVEFFRISVFLRQFHVIVSFPTIFIFIKKQTLCKNRCLKDVESIQIDLLSIFNEPKEKK